MSADGYFLLGLVLSALLWVIFHNYNYMQGFTGDFVEELEKMGSLLVVFVYEMNSLFKVFNE